MCFTTCTVCFVFIFGSAKSSKKYANPNSSDSNDSDNSSHVTKAEESAERKRLSDEFWEQENLKLDENIANMRQGNKKGTANKKAGVKRKMAIDHSSDEEDDSQTNQQSAKLTKFKEPKEQIKKVVKRKRKGSPAKGKTQETNLAGEENNPTNTEDNQFNSSVRVNDCSLGFIDELQMSKDIGNVNQRKFLHDFPTSTPRDHKQKLIVNVQNLSPIVLNKEHLSVADIEPISKEKHVLRESNLNEVSSQMTSSSKESNKVLEPKSVQVVRKGKSQSEDKDHAVKESNDENNSSMNDLLAVNASIDNNKNRQENDILQVTSVPQSNGETQFLNATPLRRNQRHNIPSFVESPLLFDDTDNKQSQHQNKDCSDASNNMSHPPEESNDKSVKTSDKGKKSSAAFKNLNEELENDQSENFNESSYSPHDWSNDYESSYEDFTNKNKTVVNRTEGPEESNLEKNSEDSQIDQNNTSLGKELSKESTLNENASTQQQSSGDSELQKIQDVAEAVDILDPRNESNNIIIPNESSDDQNQIPEMENVISANNKNFIDPIDEIDSNSNSFELHVESNTSSTKSDSSISEDQRSSKITKTTESIVNQPEEQITDVSDKSSKIDNMDEKIVENLVNHENQVNECSRPTLSSTLNEREESIQNNKVDERLNGQKLIIRLTRVSPDFYKSSPIFLSKTSKKKQLQIKAKNVKKGRISRRRTIETVSINKNSDIEKLDDQEAANHSQKLDNPSRESKSFVLSGRVTKNKTNKEALKKSTRTSTKKKESYKSYAMDIVENGILHNETGSEGSEDKYKKLYQVFKIKELRVLVSKLRDSDMENKVSASMRKSTSQTIKRRSSRKSKSINKQGDKSGYESPIKTVEDSIVDMDAEPDNSIKIDNNTGVEQNILTVNEQSNSVNKNEINASFNGEELCDILSKLNDPVKITMRRNTYKKLERPLAAITEHFVEHPSRIDEEEENDNEEENNIEPRKTNKNLVTDSSIEESEANKSAEDQTHPIFLKPGKSWARSLSIINHFHTGQNLDQLAVGRGKSWRHSVQTVLNMQSEGIFYTVFSSMMISLHLVK